MAGAGFKNFTTGEVLTASDVQGYLMDQSVMVFAGTAARASAIPSPSEGMVTYRSDDDAVEVYDGSAWSSIGGVGAAVISSPAATGSYSSGGTTYNYYTFTASGTVTVDTAGQATVLVIGGGGGGGGGISGSHFGAGGAAAPSREYDVFLTAGSHTVTIGGGGSGGTSGGSAGNPSRIGNYGFGIGSYAVTNSRTGGSNFDYSGYNTGSGLNSGGGAGSGASSTSQTGGAGASSSITGSSVQRGGGGGGAASGAGGAGGGGAAGNGGSVGSPGTANTGSGGGGGNSSLAGGNGGSGIVIIRVAV